MMLSEAAYKEDVLMSMLWKGCNKTDSDMLTKTPWTQRFDEDALEKM